MQLTELNFELYAAQHYDNPNCTDVDEFHDDLQRISYVKRLFKKYRKSGDLKEQLILNHLIVLYNVFYHAACTRMLVVKLKEYHDILKPFLLYMNYWPEYIDSIPKPIKSSDISLDSKVIDRLRKLDVRR